MTKKQAQEIKDKMCGMCGMVALVGEHIPELFSELSGVQAVDDAANVVFCIGCAKTIRLYRHGYSTVLVSAISATKRRLDFNIWLRDEATEAGALRRLTGLRAAVDECGSFAELNRIRERRFSVISALSNGQFLS